MRYKKINVKEYAEKLRKEFKENPSLWYNVILPKEKVPKLIEQTGGDYSLIWHEHCDECFTSIDKNSCEFAYVSEEPYSWLCEQCYNKQKRD